MCADGWFGFNCSQQCVGGCRDSAYCNQVTGQCDSGCAAGWTEAMCNNGNTCDFSKSQYLIQRSCQIYLQLKLLLAPILLVRFRI